MESDESRVQLIAFALGWAALGWAAGPPAMAEALESLGQDQHLPRGTRRDAMRTRRLAQSLLRPSLGHSLSTKSGHRPKPATCTPRSRQKPLRPAREASMQLIARRTTSACRRQPSSRPSLPSGKSKCKRKTQCRPGPGTGILGGENSCPNIVPAVPCKAHSAPNLKPAFALHPEIRP